MSFLGDSDTQLSESSLGSLEISDYDVDSSTERVVLDERSGYEKSSKPFISCRYLVIVSILLVVACMVGLLVGFLFLFRSKEELVLRDELLAYLVKAMGESNFHSSVEKNDNRLRLGHYMVKSDIYCCPSGSQRRSELCRVSPGKEVSKIIQARNFDEARDYADKLEVDIKLCESGEQAFQRINSVEELDKDTHSKVDKNLFHCHGYCQASTVKDFMARNPNFYEEIYPIAYDIVKKQFGEDEANMIDEGLIAGFAFSEIDKYDERCFEEIVYSNDDESKDLEEAKVDFLNFVDNRCREIVKISFVDHGVTVEFDGVCKTFRTECREGGCWEENHNRLEIAAEARGENNMEDEGRQPGQSRENDFESSLGGM